MIKSAIAILLFYLINFPLWDIFVDHGLLTPRWAAFVTYTLLFFIMAFLFSRELKEQWMVFRELVTSKKRFFIEIVLWAIAGSILTSIFIFIFGNLLNINLIPGNQENVNEMVEELPAILSLIMMAVYAPLIEESVFRHAMIGWVDKEQKILLFIMTILAVVLFDFIHVMNPPEFFYYLPLSILLTALYWKYNRNVWASIMFHSFFNAAGFVLIFLGFIK